MATVVATGATCGLLVPRRTDRCMPRPRTLRPPFPPPSSMNNERARARASVSACACCAAAGDGHWDTAPPVVRQAPRVPTNWFPKPIRRGCAAAAFALRERRGRTARGRMTVVAVARCAKRVRGGTVARAPAHHRGHRREHASAQPAGTAQIAAGWSAAPDGQNEPSAVPRAGSGGEFRPSIRALAHPRPRRPAGRTQAGCRAARRRGRGRHAPAPCQVMARAAASQQVAPRAGRRAPRSGNESAASRHTCWPPSVACFIRRLPSRRISISVTQFFGVDLVSLSKSRPHCIRKARSGRNVSIQRGHVARNTGWHDNPVYVEGTRTRCGAHRGQFVTRPSGGTPAADDFDPCGTRAAMHIDVPCARRRLNRNSPHRGGSGRQCAPRARSPRRAAPRGTQASSRRHSPSRTPPLPEHGRAPRAALRGRARAPRTPLATGTMAT